MYVVRWKGGGKSSVDFDVDNEKKIFVRICSWNVIHIEQLDTGAYYVARTEM